MPTRWPSSGRGRLVRGCDSSSAGAAVGISGAASKGAAAAGVSGGATPAASEGGAAPAGSSAAPPSCVAAAEAAPGTFPAAAPPSWAASGGSAGPGAPACLSAPSLVKLFIGPGGALPRLAGTRRAARTASRRRTLVKKIRVASAQQDTGVRTPVESDSSDSDWVCSPSEQGRPGDHPCPAAVRRGASHVGKLATLASRGRSQ